MGRSCSGWVEKRVVLKTALMEEKELGSKKEEERLLESGDGAVAEGAHVGDDV